MSAKRKSKIWKINREDLLKIINSSSSFKEALSHFELENKGENFRALRKRMEEDKIEFDHFLKIKDLTINRYKETQPIANILIINSSYTNRFRLKIRLFREGLLSNKCAICGQGPEWNGKPLTLQLDHINGISNDNRIENLRILCPHCHSQTENYAGKNKTRQNKV